MLIFWKGHGLLIPVFAVAGFAAGGVLNTARLGGSGVGISCWLGAAAVWVYALTLGRTTHRIVHDPATNSQVILRRQHSLYFLPPLVWAIGMTGLAVLMSAVELSEGKGVSQRHDLPAKTVPKSAADFAAADATIESATAGAAHGNSREAIELAKAFATICQEARELAISKGKPDSLGLTDGKFLTYAHLTPTRCIILVQVPNLRKFTQEAKDAMAKICWRTEQALAARLTPRPKTLALGIRGVLLYDRAYVGHIPKSDGEVADGIEMREDRSPSKNLLIPLFASEAPAQVANLKAPAPGKITAVSAADEKSQEAAPAPQSQPPQSPTVQASAKTTVSLPTEIRDWKSADGRPMRAALVRFMDDSKVVAEFRREDGQTFQVPVERFRAEDQEFIRSLSAH